MLGSCLDLVDEFHFLGEDILSTSFFATWPDQIHQRYLSLLEWVYRMDRPRIYVHVFTYIQGIYIYIYTHIFCIYTFMRTFMYLKVAQKTYVSVSIHTYMIYTYSSKFSWPISPLLPRVAHPLPWQLPLDLAAYPSPGMSPTLAPTWRVGRDVPWASEKLKWRVPAQGHVPCFLGVHKWCFFGCQEKKSPDR